MTRRSSFFYIITAFTVVACVSRTVAVTFVAAVEITAYSVVAQVKVVTAFVYVCVATQAHRLLTMCVSVVVAKL